MKHAPLLLALTLCTACPSIVEPPDPCDEIKACFVADEVGCCLGDAINISVCGLCPTDYVEQTECRTTGCELECETPILCRTDLEAGCCGDVVLTTHCDTCPVGSVPESDCLADYPNECGCGPAIGGFRAPGMADPIQPRECFVDLGSCCGESVGPEGPCGCGVGTLELRECQDRSGFAQPQASECHVSYGGGCCGEEVQPSLACGGCAEGTVPAERCASFLGVEGEPSVPTAPSNLFEVTAEGRGLVSEPGDSPVVFDLGNVLVGQSEEVTITYDPVRLLSGTLPITRAGWQSGHAEYEVLEAPTAFVAGETATVRLRFNAMTPSPQHDVFRIQTCIGYENTEISAMSVEPL